MADNIAYLCDRHACDGRCPSLLDETNACRHTLDIQHAVNFQNVGTEEEPKYMEVSDLNYSQMDVVSVDAQKRKSKGFAMKVYAVFKGDYYYVTEVLKIFSDLDKAIDYATDVVMEQISKYDRDYVKQTITARYNNLSSHSDSFVCTNCRNIDPDEYSVGILEVDADI